MTEAPMTPLELAVLVRSFSNIAEMPPRGQRKEVRTARLSPEQIQTALEKAAKWPEVER